jgi:hypothetical protein
MASVGTLRPIGLLRRLPLAVGLSVHPLRRNIAMIFYIKRGFFCAFFAFVSSQALATDAYSDYVADLYLHESHQARNPNQVVRYTDGNNGALLQEILKPNRVKAVLSSYLEFTKSGENVPDVPKLLQPLQARYEAAFKKAPSVYESEYLDSLEGSAEVMSTASLMMRASAQPASKSTQSGFSSEDQKALAESFQSLQTSMRDLNALFKKAIVDEIRNKVAKGMFSENGAKRALAISDRLESK